MPKRQSFFTVDASSVQGEGAWVRFRKPKLRAIRAMKTADNDKDADKFELGLDMVKDHLLDWNWVDDDGAPLANPVESPDITDELNLTELEFLALALVGEEEENNLKN